MNNEKYFLHIGITNEGFIVWDTDAEGMSNKLTIPQVMGLVSRCLKEKQGICKLNRPSTCHKDCHHCTENESK
jgi:hypothetical protein